MLRVAQDDTLRMGTKGEKQILHSAYPMNEEPFMGPQTRFAQDDKS